MKEDNFVIEKGEGFLRCANEDSWGPCGQSRGRCVAAGGAGGIGKHVGAQGWGAIAHPPPKPVQRGNKGW